MNGYNFYYKSGWAKEKIAMEYQNARCLDFSNKGKIVPIFREHLELSKFTKILLLTFHVYTFTYEESKYKNMHCI